MATTPVSLSKAQTEALTSLFKLLDLNNDGVLQLSEFTVLGEAMLGKAVCEADSKESQTP